MPDASVILHTCHVCGEQILPDQLQLQAEGERVYFVHVECLS